MFEAKNTQRAVVRIGYDGRVYKQFQGPEAEKRFENECKALLYLEKRKCPFVPRLIAADKNRLEIVTSNCGARVERMGEERIKEIFAELESYGIRHDDPYLRNITYRASDGRFCIIDFEFSTFLEESSESASEEENAASDATQPRDLKWSAMTHQGTFRTNNEDRFLAMLIDERGVRYLGKQGSMSTANCDLLFAVADGMGGERSGELAGKIALDNITRLLPRAYMMSERHLEENSQSILKELYAAIHSELVKLGSYDPLCINMGATLTMVWVHKSVVMFAHVGDTRLYRLRKNAEGDMKMEQASEDHTHVGWLRRSGKINEREARTHPRKNVLAKALGAGNQFAEPQVGRFTLQAGEKLILCTDGVTDGLWDRAIEDLVLRPESSVIDQSPAQRLVLNAVAESGRDNATAIVLES
ncbi:Serine/threonine phosphatase stp [Pirellula sp. SH-Sr6A]|uniref:protein phosphatase 2C domain-containing protein n=1 Tax=Pirellula sp. SH-Sr6A TaxID=1632865 RepID=UPI00078E6447|nr:protein phosphatase 2C domain-containing protein [Pirellula sp. SH-Sr6A]AMV33321.1 Serine/threonine phosphatase stp [Pirellula sp. SH-Sr6A]